VRYSSGSQGAFTNQELIKKIQKHTKNDFLTNFFHSYNTFIFFIDFFSFYRIYFNLSYLAFYNPFILIF
jgi:hypothetical protein